MDYRKLEDLKLAKFAADVLTILGGALLTSVDAHVTGSLAASIGALPATFEDQCEAAKQANDARKSAVSTKNGTRKMVLALMKQVRDTLVASNAPREQWDLLGFDYPDYTISRYIPNDPSKLSAVGYSNGVNEIRFSGNNSHGRVVYEIWRRHGDTIDWGLHATTKRQSHSDSPVTPGQYYEYKVRAVAARALSNFSNSAVVYGAP